MKEERAKLAQLSVRVPEPVAVAFRSYAAQRGVSVQQLLADFISYELRQEDAPVVAVNRKTVRLDLWRETVDALEKISSDARVPMSEIVNSVCAEFIERWSGDKS